MQRTGAIRHTHRYMKAFPYRYNPNHVWKCTLPGCTHFIPLNMSALGLRSICWECGEEFFLSEASLERERPICHECANPVDTSAVRAQIAELEVKYNDSTLSDEEKRRIRLEINFLKETFE